MSETTATTPRRGQKLLAADGRRIGTVDAVFADYLLVRTSGLLPVDLYVPRNEVAADAARPADGGQVVARRVPRLASAVEAGAA